MASLDHNELTHCKNVKSCIIGTGSPLAQVMACCLFGTKLSTEPMLTYSQMDPQEQTSVIFDWSKSLQENAFENVSKMAAILFRSPCDNTLRPPQNGCHLARIFKMHFLQWKRLKSILIKIPLVFVPEGQIDKESTLDQVMAWHLSGTKSLPEPILNRVHNTACHHSDTMC